MTTVIDPQGHVLPGQGHPGHGHVPVGSGHGGFGTPVYVPVHTPKYYPVYTSPYYVDANWDGRFGVLAGGITLLILGIALAALGFLGLAYGDIPWGITATVTGGLASAGGIAMIIYDLATRNYE